MSLVRPQEQQDLRFLKKAIFDVGLFSSVVNVLLLTSPLYLLQVYDRVLAASSIETLVYLSIAALLALVVLGVLEVVRGQYVNRIAARLDAELGTRAFLNSLQSPRAVFGDVQPLRDLATIRSFAGSRSVLFLFDVPFTPFFLVLLYLVHPLVCLLTSVGATVLVAIAIANQLATARTVTAAANSLLGATNLAQALVRNSDTLKPLGMVSNATEVWGCKFAQSLHASDQLTRINAFYSGLSRTLRMILQIAILGAGAYLVLNEDMTAGMIFAASLIAGRALQPIDQVIGAWRQIIDSYGAWKRLREDVEPARGASSQFALPTPNGNLFVEDLVYQPPAAAAGAPPIIRRVGFQLAAGQSLAIIGPSGAGKTTLARLLVGALQPTAGAVRLDGADLRNWQPDVLGHHLGYLPQELELFPGTVAQNIARLHPTPQDNEVIKAARWADVHDLILRLENGYATQIGPGGMQLSGGERQRIGLARALYGEPKLLVLDEPNANLDAEGEAALSRAIAGVREHKVTLVVVTHKISIAEQLDHILLLRDGLIELMGPSAKVLQRLGLAAKNQLPPATNQTAASAAGQPQRAPSSGGARR
ncbi:type I secretion system permease/ATPase [Pelagibacterium sp. H642]|uniref:type I secretion system permease/ATPase n=1 Tax=Pelagibacterium sp. H642 TaxID=1881069 RepID=UPI002814D0E0|nr:type I secretion system permease/ATPase [Pelagibacterium sp. H642]WMT92861.1 type I secretion system permease/ATPase [Pelagibacterium sp. H642]